MIFSILPCGQVNGQAQRWMALAQLFEIHQGLLDNLPADFLNQAEIFRHGNKTRRADPAVLVIMPARQSLDTRWPVCGGIDNELIMRLYPAFPDRLAEAGGDIEIVETQIVFPHLAVDLDIVSAL